MTDVSSMGPEPGDGREVLTNRQGHPVYDNQNQRTVGARGPATLENYQFLEKISHFDRERIPERVVHARGTTAFGYFEAYGRIGDEPIGALTRAKLFQEAGKRTPVAVRFSTVIGGRDSSDHALKPVDRCVRDNALRGLLFGTGVLDGLDFSDDKMLVGRTFSYSDTQRYRVGPNYLQLPVNQPKHGRVRTNQRDGLMTYRVDQGGENPHVNYEPSITGGLREARYPTHDEQGPTITGRVTRKRIPRTNDYAQAGRRYLLMHDWERDDLVHNLVTMLSQCERPIQERMVWHFLLAEDDLGLRVGEGLGIGPDDVAHLEPPASQDLTEEDRARLEKLGHNGPRDVNGPRMTHCVPDDRATKVG
ncbi:hypothetical protein GCM10023195_62160 [Actinoallomurus liliacearum]|uniref:Catalase n=1 Tax=Actinoallomurus liliacearum TaxID=1080073 RepID=A0ABP8TSY0_9ACTN